ncbi:hypothetical protein EGW08_008248, partial [Elysia chlorotica]
DPQVNWTKDNSDLDESDRVSHTRQGDVHRLEIRSASPADSGTYFCTARNSEGQVVATVTVTVEDSKSQNDFQKDSNSASNQHGSGDGSAVDDETVGDDQGAVGGQLLPGSDRSVSRSPEESRTLRYAKLVGMAAAFSLAALGANKVFDLIRK